MALSNKTKIGGTAGIIGSILASVLFFEGGYVNNPYDPGGETKYGITEHIARQYGYDGEMKDLSKDFAKKVYTEEYIVKPGYIDLIPIAPAVAHKLIDAGVNVGTGRSTLWFQRAINSLTRNSRTYVHVNEDGVCGKGTIAGYKRLVTERGPVMACEMTIKLIYAQQANHYMSLKNLPQFTAGWINKRVGNIPLSWCSDYELSYKDALKNHIE